MKTIFHKILLLLAEYFNPVEKTEALNNTAATIPHSPANAPVGGLSLNEYDSYFVDPEKRKAAFEKAWQVRNFEIEHYWKRATYFWAFIAAAFAGYIAVISSNKYPLNFLLELEYYIICLGLIFSFAWFLVNWGSKKWQENWEGHIDRLEESFTGPLYRVVISDVNFSVSKVNLLVSAFICCIWFVLAIQYLIKNVSFCNSENGFPFHAIIASLLSLIAITLFLTWGRTGSSKGRSYYVRPIK